LDSGDTAWVLTSTVLVLMMTLPGLMLFYGSHIILNYTHLFVMKAIAWYFREHSLSALSLGTDNVLLLRHWQVASLALKVCCQQLCRHSPSSL
jgi:ammonia channel protein AmtB